ncbi:MAG: efflux RND transporter periplasmic adaptor subunit [Eubacteriales bacterium]|nr:efflux RND transporter periplasmic adaptor subunit [Eubacteriales bacterium]
MNKKKILLISLLAVGLIATYMFVSNLNKKVEVTVTQAQRGNLSKYIEDSGEVFLSEQQIIYAGATGYISDIYFEVGENISKSSKILDINSSEVKNIILQRNKILEEISIAERNLEDNHILLENKNTLKEAGALSPREYTEFYNSVKNEEGRLENLKRELSFLNNSLGDTNTRISSPLDAVLLDKYVKKGDFVLTGTPLVMVGNTGNTYIESDVLTSEIKDIKEGNQVLISNNNLEIFDVEGQVSKIYPMAFSKMSDLGVEQNRVKVKIDIIEENENIKPGYVLDLKIITESKENVIFIPENSIFQINDEDYVFIVENDKANLRKITKGIESKRNIEILEGISEGELIITAPSSDLEEGIRVEIK